ncbi:MAG: sulfotransferase [Cyanobacteria bacterium P01_H01_bin.35]
MKEKKDFTAYKKHPLCGGSFINWIKLVISNGGIDSQYIPRALSVSQESLLTIPLRILEQVKFGKKIEDLSLEFSPIFIVGHWRSGTTYLLNLLAQDKNLGYISRLQGFRGSEIFLSAYELAKRWAEEDFNRNRISDNIIMSANFPCEEEFALANSSSYSFYLGFYFPKNITKIFERNVLFEGLDEKEKKEWKKVYQRLIKKITLSAEGKRLVLKNPLNTARIPILLEMFPEAKFIHIYRNPYKVYASTNQLFKRLIKAMVFQNVSEADIEKNIIFFYQQMMQKFLDDKKMIEPENLVEIKYEDFIGNEMAELKRIYTNLNLSGFAEAEYEFKKSLESQKNYQVNQYVLDRETIDTITKEWRFTLEEWQYSLPDDISISEKVQKPG